MKKLIHKYWDVLTYLVFGVLTTVVNYLVAWYCHKIIDISVTINNSPMDLSGAVSNVIAWVVAVIFAFLTNKPFVFRSHDWSSKVLFPELGKFLGCRIGSLIVETGIIFLTVDLMKWSFMWMKLATNVLVIIINYIGSKLIVFRKEEKNTLQ